MAKSKKSADGDAAAPATQGTSSWLWLLTLLLAGAFVASGLVGHEPWTEREAQAEAAVASILESGDYLVPQVDGDPALQAPPLYYMTGAGLAQVLSEYLPAPQAARVATGVFLAITLLFTALAARAAWRPGDGAPLADVGAAAVLVLIGTLGVVWFGHDMIADTGLMAGMAMGLFGLALLPRKVLLGGLWLGTGAGVAFMSHGVLGPGVLAITLVLSAFIGIAKFGRYLKGLVVAILFALPWLLIWPALLNQRNPELYQLWLAGTSVGGYLDGISLGTQQEQLDWLKILLVLAFPAWLLGVLTLVLRPGALFGFAGVRAALLATLVGAAAIVTAEAAEPVTVLALMVPLAVLAAGGVQRLPGLFVWPVHWLSVLLFGVIAVALWGAWIWLLYQGEPPPVEGLGAFLPMDQGFTWQPAVYLTAAVLTVIWLWLVMRFRPSRPAALLAWPAGVVMVWSLLALHQPWLDAAMTEGRLAKRLPLELLEQAPRASSTVAKPTAVAPAAGEAGVESAAATPTPTM
jgi:4-amino-4-deoxy-L-arabinose transferase-like glycosyltransferase